MKRIRIEKDITVRWSGILTNGEPVSLEGRDLKMYLVNPLGSSKEVTDFNVTDNNIQFLFRASEQKYLGIYRLKLYENYGRRGQTVLDQCEGFCLVATTCQEGGSTEGLDTETVELSGGDLTLNPQDIIYSKELRIIKILSQSDYDKLEHVDESTMYIIV